MAICSCEVGGRALFLEIIDKWFRRGMANSVSGTHSKRLWLFFGFALHGLSLCTASTSKNDTYAALKRVHQDWRDLQLAFAGYAVDRCNIYYPPDTSGRRRTDSSVAQTFETSTARERDDVSDPIWDPLHRPVPYIQSLPTDPFTTGAFYGYASWNIKDQTPTAALLHSPGPDRDTDLPIGILHDKISSIFAANSGRKRQGYDPTRDEWKAIRGLIEPNLYDPTNGAISSGDLIQYLNSQQRPYVHTAGGTRWDLQTTSVVNVQVRRRELAGNTEGQIKLPQRVAAFVQESRLLDESGRLNAASIHRVQNRLHRSFADFFEAPRPLTSAEAAVLGTWMRDEPRWWDAFANPQQSAGVVKLGTSELEAILPLYGKSRLLLQASERWHPGGNSSRAEEEEFRSTLRHFEQSDLGTAHLVHIALELLRLSIALEHSLESEGASR